MTSEAIAPICPLCKGNRHQLFHQDSNKRSQRPYYRCQNCALVFVPNEYYLSAEVEKAEYDKHQNSAEDSGYRQFLQRFFTPFCEKVDGHTVTPPRVLDFGCGPGPVLAQMYQEHGYSVEIFDVFYANDPEVLTTQTYDAISATEVIEHVHDAAGVVDLWLSMLRPGGTLGIMTKLVSTQEAFKTWHYKNDLTHIAFYSRETFQYLALKLALNVEFHGKDVILLSKT